MSSSKILWDGILGFKGDRGWHGQMEGTVVFGGWILDNELITNITCLHFLIFKECVFQNKIF